MVANIVGLARFRKRNRRSCEFFYARREKTLGQKRRPEMRLLFAGYLQTDLLTELKQWGLKMLFSLFT